VVPLLRERRVLGVLAVGRKASGGDLSADDLDVLRTLANEVAVALGTAAAVEQLQDARERLARSERLAAIGELSAAVAHGIRNPLAGIRLATQLGLEAAERGESVQENLEDVLAEVDKLEAQVRGILDFARPFEPRLEAVEVPELVRSLFATLAPRFETRGVTLRLTAPPDLPPVLADRAHLGQAIQELLTNAADAMPTGGRVTVDATVAEGAPLVRIGVQDTGPGVTPEVRDRIFQLFMTTKATGTGVGLAVAKKIVERHGGTIAIGDNVPHGTRFTIDLPCAQGAI
jgi:two-component system, NtrC family, sensor histidine kinase HydH